MGGRVGMTVAGGLLTVGLLAACTADPARPDPAVQAPPPPPPAACLLDTGALATATGLTWTPDQTTATDTRCVYDPRSTSRAEQQAGSGFPANEFLAVDIAPATAPDVASQLDTVAAVCDGGSRAPVDQAGSGFVCRFEGGSVFAAIVHGGQLVTVGASAVPEGTSAAQLVLGLSQQLGAIGR